MTADTSGQLQLATGASATTAITVDTSQNVGIGTTSPSTVLHTYASNAGTPTTSGSATTGVSARFQNSSVNFDIGTYASGPCFIQSRLTGNNATNFDLILNPNGGNVGIGTTSPAYSGYGKTLTVASSAAGGGVIEAATLASDASGNYAGTVVWSAANNTAGQKSIAQIDAVTTGTTANNRGGYMYFSTKADGGSGAERMRIDASGNVLVGATTTGSFNTPPNGLGVYSTGGQWQVMSLKHGTAGNACVINYATPSTTGFGWDAGVQNSSTNWMFRYNASQISNINSSTGVYTATSDINKKKDFAESNIGLTEVLQLKPTLFRMIVDGNDTPLQLGFIAQEVKKCIPQAYVQENEFIGLQDRPIIAALTKAIQEQQTIINDLKARIETLEAK